MKDWKYTEIERLKIHWNWKIENTLDIKEWQTTHIKHICHPTNYMEVFLSLSQKPKKTAYTLRNHSVFQVIEERRFQWQDMDVG